jgi:chromosome segregation ATPase
VKFHEQGEVLLTTKKSLAATEPLLMNNNALMCQLTLDLKAAQEELQAAVADKAQVAPQLAELTEQLAQRDANIATLDRTIKELTAKVKELSADAIKLKAAKKEAQDAQERAVKLSGKSQDQIATYLKTIADGNMTIQQLNAKVALLEEQVFELSADEKPHLEKAEGVKPATSKRQITLRTVPQDDAERIKDGYLNPIPTTVGQSPHSTFNNDDSSKRKLRMTKSPQIAPVASTTSNRRP